MSRWMALALLLLPCVIEAQTVDSMSMTADSTLSINSFEFQSAPGLAQLAKIRTDAAAALTAGKISPARAKVIQSKCDHVRALIDTSLKVCNPDPNDGHCKGSDKGARAVLAKAYRDLSNIEVKP